MKVRGLDGIVGFAFTSVLVSKRVMFERLVIVLFILECLAKRKMKIRSLLFDQ